MEAIGIIDIGSNTLRLSVVEIRADGAYRVCYEAKAGLRLGARLSVAGALGPEAVEDTVHVITGFVQCAADWPVAEWVGVATAAVRQALNRDDFLRQVSMRTGIPLRVLTGEEEAALGFIGALNTLAERNGYLVDIGGASTEISRFADRRLIQSVSLPFGAVNAMAAFKLGARVGPGPLHALEEALERAASLAQADVWIGPQPDATLVGVGGTVRALAKMDRRGRNYPLEPTHNYLLPPAGVKIGRAHV